MASRILIINTVIKDASGNVSSIEHTIGYEAKSNKNSSDYIKGTYTPTAGDRLFFTKDCTVPRFKVKTLCEKHNLSVTRDRSKATAIFISDKFVEEYISKNWYYQCSAEALKEHIKKTPFSYNVQVINLIKFITDNNVEKLCFHYYNNDVFDINGFELDMKSNHIRYCTQENFDTIKDLFTGNITYIQDDILKILNQDVVIDKEMYKQMDAMLQSGDNSNTKMAMEIMANSNYEHSAPYLLLLFKNHGYRIWDSGFRNHVNFKSLVEFFGVNNRRGYTNLDLDEIINILKSKNFLTKENIGIFMPLAYDEIRDTCSYDHFKVSKIEFIEDPKDDEEVLNIEDEDPAF